VPDFLSLPVRDLYRDIFGFQFMGYIPGRIRTQEEILLGKGYRLVSFFRFGLPGARIPGFNPLEVFRFAVQVCQLNVELAWMVFELVMVFPMTVTLNTGPGSGIG
jgi:hypothetical protein